MSNEEEIIVYQQEDKTINVTVKDSDGDPIDFSTGYNNVVIIIYNADESPLQKYSRTATGGWVTLATTTQNIGKFTLSLQSEITKAGSVGKKYIEVLVRKTDGALTDGKYDSIAKKYLFTLKKSVSAAIVLP